MSEWFWAAIKEGGAIYVVLSAALLLLSVFGAIFALPDLFKNLLFSKNEDAASKEQAAAIVDQLGGALSHLKQIPQEAYDMQARPIEMALLNAKQFLTAAYAVFPAEIGLGRSISILSGVLIIPVAVSVVFTGNDLVAGYRQDLKLVQQAAETKAVKFGELEAEIKYFQNQISAFKAQEYTFNNLLESDAFKSRFSDEELTRFRQGLNIVPYKTLRVPETIVPFGSQSSPGDLFDIISPLSPDDFYRALRDEERSE
ncbi:MULTISPECIES: hypothetical protein [unclassified Pseudovibrio]|uniref:hypothetical protein n=1 Tax=unclassified Pseudovibrio TaxID=2627060 RepID=UPI0007AEB35A|nr:MULTISPECIES: hypothetical protein [unclassified Pseudovibrio]KZK95021.1 hypothetical protein PsW74_04282 [Pseudovibrio sp. W74]KZL08824.1 hypothetical protein PsAD14_02768 [Pseudovibrio sp. Ad14]